MNNPEGTATIVTVIFVVVAVGALVFQQVYDDNYCRTIPIERMDKERCGL